MEISPATHFDPLDSTDESLVWSLEAFENRQRAVRFVRHFQSLLCVYSPRVHQLYGSYEVVVPRRQDRELVVVPDLFAFHDTWYQIPRDAVRPTRMMILPGELVQGEGLHLRIPFGDGRRGRVVPLSRGLRVLVRQGREHDRPFLPVITRGDLRALRRRTPLLHLHRLEPRAMGDRSRFEISDICRTIEERLRQLLRQEP